MLAYAVVLQATVQQINTDHYTVYFDEGSEYSALRIAEIAEEVFNPLAAMFDAFEDYTRIHITVNNNVDYGNGWANYYQNRVNINTTNLNFPLRGTHDWLYNVVTHELTHIFSLKAAARNWGIFNGFELRVFFPARKNPFYISHPFYHMVLPAWFVEGIAQFEDDLMGYETWDTHRDMLLRMAVLENDLLSWSQMAVMRNKDKFYSEMVYNQGYSLLKYVHERFGEGKVEALTDKPGLVNFNSTVKKVLGISASKLYKDWAKHLKEKYAGQKQRVGKSPFKERRLLKRGFYNFHAKFSPDGSKIAFISSENLDYAGTYLVIYDLSTKKRTVYKKDFVFSNIDWVPGQEKIVFTSPREGQSAFNDIYIFDLKTKKRKPISANLRAVDFDVSADGKQIVFVRNDDGSNNIGISSIDGSKVKYLTHHIQGTQYYTPQWSPDGQKIIFSIYKQGQDRDIGMINATALPFDKKKLVLDSTYSFNDSIAFDSTAEFTLLVASQADERDPIWSPDGKSIIFSSDRDGIFNLYEYRLEEGKVRKLTDVLGGAFVPAISPDGKDLIYIGYHAQDFDIYHLEMDKVPFLGEDSLVSLERDYQALEKARKIEDYFRVGPFKSHLSLVDVSPFVVIEAPYFWESEGLTMVGGGMSFALDNLLGGNQIRGGFGVYKNLEAKLGINYDLHVGFNKHWRTVLTENKNYTPSISLNYSQFVRHYKFHGMEYPLLNIDTVLIPFDLDSFIVVRNFVADVQTVIERKYSFLSFSSSLPLNRYNRFSFYADNSKFTDRRYLLRDIVVIDNFFDRDTNAAGEFTTIIKQPTQIDTFELNGEELPLWEKEFFNRKRVGFVYTYMNLMRIKNVLSTLPTGGRYFQFAYFHNRNIISNVAAIDLFSGRPPQNFDVTDRFNYPFTFYDDRFIVNLFVTAYGEYYQLPYFPKTIFNWSALSLLQDKRVPFKTPFGGIVWSYWPHIYWVGNFLLSYPYINDFNLLGSNLWFFNAQLHVPLINDLKFQFLHLYFGKVYLSPFFRAADVWDTPVTQFKKDDVEKFQKMERIKDYFKNDVLKEAGLTLVMQNFMYYFIPYDFYATIAWPLNEEYQELNKYRVQLGFSYGF